MIEIRNVWKRYGEKVVLEKLSLQVEQNEFVTIVGSSGCGKTTFLRMLLGEVEPSEGSISLDNIVLATEPNASRGVVFQRYSVYPHLTVLENVVLGLDFGTSRLVGRSFGKKRKRHAELARSMLVRVGLERSLHSYPTELSGGMQQRLALAQTLVTEPKILLLDEPFGALDPGYRMDMHELVLGLHQELSLTVFMTTHDISEGFNLGSRLLVFDKTRLDPHEPDLFGATITLDLPLNETRNGDALSEHRQAS